MTTLEDVERTARRVLGAAHPDVIGIERSLRNARALHARETPPAPLPITPPPPLPVVAAPPSSLMGDDGDETDTDDDHEMDAHQALSIPFVSE